MENELDLNLELPPVLAYHKIYAERHKLNPQAVANAPAFDLAAYLEYLVGSGVITIQQARYRFVEQYPSSNCMYIYGKSVCRLILPYKDQPRFLLNQDEKLAERGNPPSRFELKLINYIDLDAQVRIVREAWVERRR